MRVVTLGSRKNLCVNAQVKVCDDSTLRALRQERVSPNSYVRLVLQKLSSVGAINDRCLDMQKQKTLVTGASIIRPMIRLRCG
jgi:hypothetical protein